MTIPFRIAINDQWVPGEINPVSGAGSTAVYYVMVNKFYWGRLRMYQNKWVHDASPGAEHDFAAFLTFWLAL